MEDTAKFFAFWIQLFDAIEKHWPKEKKGKAANEAPSGTKSFMRGRSIESSFRTKIARNGLDIHTIYFQYMPK
jgi:hypothetical protein